MKVDKRNPVHWLLLVGFWIQAVAGVLLRTLSHSRSGRVVLYGHKLSGNLLALYRYMENKPETGFRPVFLSMDRAYIAALWAQGISCQWASGPPCGVLLAQASALVSDHGLHSLEPLRAAYRRLGLPFFDVWHGIPFKGFDAEDFKVQHRYDEVWVASPSQRDLYVDRFGFEPEIVHATGYARTDRLVRREGDVDAIKRNLGLDPATCGKLILFAPTWKQAAGERSLFPFGVDAAIFMETLSNFAMRAGATVLLRTHLNSGDQAIELPARVVPVPYARFPDTESFLLASDVLVCDWSSIAFDFLLLDRPTIFLDVPPPFAKGFSLGPEYRFGLIVPDLGALLEGLGQALRDPAAYWEAHGGEHARIREVVYAGFDDGGSAGRCITRLDKALVRSGSSRSQR